MTRLFLIFILLITFNANSIAGSVMMSSMGNMDVSMSQDDCHADMEMMGHCESGSSEHEGCDESNCGACVYHCSSAMIVDISLITVLTSPLLAFQYLLTEARSVYSRMLRPPQTV